MILEDEPTLPEVQIGFPVLPDQETRMEIFRECLRVCEEQHKSFGCPLEFVPHLPSRILDVGDNKVRLHISQPRERGDYIALSHC